jgi:hypothetical protein
MNVVERGRHKDNNKSLLVRYSVSLIYNNATDSGVGLVLHCQGTSSGHLLSLAVLYYRCPYYGLQRRPPLTYQSCMTDGHGVKLSQLTLPINPGS